MTNTQFIVALKKALAGLDKTSRNDIIEEIKSHAIESGAPLIDQFGSVDELAKQYLDGEKIAKPITAKIWGISKKVFMLVGLLVLALIALIALLAYFFTKDKFDYADENAEELAITSAGWQSKPWSADVNFVIDQASVVLYWHDDASLRWKCDGSSPEAIDNSRLKINQSHCLIYLPKASTTLDIKQSQVVMVKPQVSLSATTNQSAIKIAENGEKYRYDLSLSRSKVQDLITSNEAEYTLKFITKDTKLSAYKY